MHKIPELVVQLEPRPRGRHTDEEVFRRGPDEVGFVSVWCVAGLPGAVRLVDVVDVAAARKAGEVEVVPQPCSEILWLDAVVWVSVRAGEDSRHLGAQQDAELVEQGLGVDVSLEVDDLCNLGLEFGLADRSADGALNALGVGIRNKGGEGAIDEPLRLRRKEHGGAAGGVSQQVQ